MGELNLFRIFKAIAMINNTVATDLYFIQEIIFLVYFFLIKKRLDEHETGEE